MVLKVKDYYYLNVVLHYVEIVEGNYEVEHNVVDGVVEVVPNKGIIQRKVSSKVG